MKLFLEAQMFVIQQTEIRPIFRTTLEKVMDRLRATRVTHTEYLCYDGGELLFANPHANKMFENEPAFQGLRRYYSPSTRNPSEEFLYGLVYPKRGENSSIFEDQLCYAVECGRIIGRIKNIDTYLCWLDPETVLESTLRRIVYIPEAFSFLVKCLRRFPDLINQLNRNPELVDYLEDHPEYINYKFLSMNTNPMAFVYLRRNLAEVDWYHISQNSSDAAIDLLEENPQHINYRALTANTNPRAIDLLKGHENEVNWSWLSCNRCGKVVEILEKAPSKVDWHMLCSHACTKEHFDFIRAHIQELFNQWEHLGSALSSNPSEFAVKLLEEYPERVVWQYSLQHQNVFETTTTYDYEGIRGRLDEPEDPRKLLREEFHAWAGHPIRMVTKWRDWGFDNYGVDEPDETDKSV
jgi:hypothetical protein